MPEISRFFGIVIRMYFDDHNPPHFHAIYAGSEAEFGIEPIGMLEGELPRSLSEITIFDHFDHKMWWSRGALIAIDGCGNSISDRLLAARHQWYSSGRRCINSN